MISIAIDIVFFVGTLSDVNSISPKHKFSSLQISLVVFVTFMLSGADVVPGIAVVTGIAVVVWRQHLW